MRTSRYGAGTDMSVRLSVVGVLLGLTVAGCGEEEPSPDDRLTGEAFVGLSPPGGRNGEGFERP
jgi:hypothetical protein